MKPDIQKCMHPGDAGGIRAVEAIPKFQSVLDYISAQSVERFYKMYYNSSLIRISETNSPLICSIVREGCEMFDVKDVPDVFIEYSYDYYVKVVGLKKPSVIISTALLENLDDKELRIYVLPYIASIAMGHNTMLFVKMLVDNFGDMLPVPKSVLQLPLNQWCKQKEYTYDRIRLILTGSFESAAFFIGIEHATRDILNATPIETRIETAMKVREYTALKGASRNYQSITSDEAWNSMRLIELFNWYESGIYSEAFSVESKEDAQ